MTDTQTLMMMTDRGEIIISDVLYNVDRVGVMTLTSPARAADSAGAASPMSELLLNLFDEEPTWGNDSTTH